MRSARMKLPGHPDHACDLVAEAIVDEYARRDPASRIRVSVAGGRGALFVAGDVRSQADFDVSALVRRTLGSMGVMADMEPFISLEPVGAEQGPLFSGGIELPVTVMGYATHETPELIPATVSLARRIAKRLEDVRQKNDAWFWLGPDAEVVVQADEINPNKVMLHVEHGTHPLSDVRRQCTELIHSIEEQLHVRVNDMGPTEARGLGNAMGASGRDSAVYGDALARMSSMVGMDSFRAEKAGAWLARSAARSLVQSGEKAVLVSAVYIPGERLPATIVARDAHGKDLSGLIDREQLSLDRVAKEWSRPNLHLDAARWGFAGEPGLPWEG